jgi:hypothetical protein
MFVNEWKNAIVTPLHKKGALDDMNNYRGISVLPIAAKIFEHVLSIQIKQYFSSNNLFSEHQHGFRTAHSCETTLHEIISDCLGNLDKKLLNALLFIDFKKAFDMVDRDLLIYKLLNYGFDNLAIKIIIDYFNGRSQVVKIDDILSNLADLLLGIAQGSCLGPLFFIIYINDLPRFLKDILSKLFADDTTLIFSGATLNVVNERMKIGIMQLNEWCKHNRLYINWSKTFIMYITTRVAIPKSILINNQTINVVDKFRLLGVLVDNKLKFDTYVAQQYLAINKRLFNIKKLFFLPQEVKMTFFKAFILPSFDYCISLALYYSKKSLQKLCKSFYFCLFKLFKFNFYNKSEQYINEFLEPFGLSSFQYRFVTKILLFIAKIGTIKAAPIVLKKQIQLKECLNLDHNLRSNRALRVEIKRRFTKFGDNMFEPIGAKLINKIDILNFYNNLFTFKTVLYRNINLIVEKFISVLPRFIFQLDFYFYLK